MRRVALTLAAIGVLGLAATQAFAEGALSYPMAAHVAAKYGVHHPGLQTTLHQVKRYGYGHSRQYRYRGPVYPYARPYVGRHPRVVVPFSGHPPVMHPRVYPRYRPYYRAPQGLRYYGPGFSIGIGF
jgi:hypothetical protein